MSDWLIPACHALPVPDAEVAVPLVVLAWQLQQLSAREMRL